LVVVLFLDGVYPLVKRYPFRFVLCRAARYRLALAHVNCINRVYLPKGRALGVDGVLVSAARSVGRVEEELSCDANRSALDEVEVLLLPGLGTKVWYDLSSNTSTCRIPDATAKDYVDVVPLRSGLLAVDARSFAGVRAFG